MGAGTVVLIANVQFTLTQAFSLICFDYIEITFVGAGTKSQCDERFPLESMKRGSNASSSNTGSNEWMHCSTTTSRIDWVDRVGL